MQIAHSDIRSSRVHSRNVLLFICILSAMVFLDACKAGNPRPNAQLISSIQNGNMKGVKLALRLGADKNQKDTKGTPAVVLAASLAHPSIVSELVMAGSDVNAVDARARTALMRSFDSRKKISPARRPKIIEILETLLRGGAGVNMSNEKGNTALMYAASKNSRHGILILLRAGAKKHARNFQGLTAVHWAARRGSTAALRTLLENGARPDARARLGVTPLMFAVWNGQFETVKMLLSKGANPSLTEKDGNTALDHAIHYKKPKIAELLRRYMKQ